MLAFPRAKAEKYQPPSRSKSRCVANSLRLMGWPSIPVIIYIDRGISGASVKKKPAFMPMVNNIKSGLFPAYLYAKDAKRLFHNDQEAGQYTEWISDRKIIIRLCLYDTGDPWDSLTSWLRGRHMHLHAEFERRAKAQETMEHMK